MNKARIVLALAVFGLAACSNGSDSGVTAGGSGAGGAANEGAATSAAGGAAGGETSTGGATNAGGTSGVGGETSNGGSPAGGGLMAAGGSKAMGGSAASGGMTAKGGTMALGGSAGGTTALGGATGGTTRSGGTTGGTTVRGGSTASSGVGATGGTSSTGGSTGGSSGNGGIAAGGTSSAGQGGATGGKLAGTPAGWLYTSGSKLLVSDGNGTGTPWMGRGVNIDDIYLCGYNSTLWMTSPDQTLTSIVSGLLSGWKPNFVRISLSMDSFATVSSWLSNAAVYKTPMTNVINAIGAHPNVYVLVTLRSDGSMIGQDQVDGDPEATGLPSDSTTTPNATSYPTGSDATYIALVDSFANSSFVMFGLTNEAGGNKLSNATITAAMRHAVGVIRSEEDRLGVPHHIVSVQGNSWTSDISFYAVTPAPITYDNVVYEVHGYPPTTSSYTYSNIPVIIGEYGSLTNSTSFYADIETKQISNLAWDFDPYSDCAPDLLSANQSATNLTPSAWGSTVQSYLLAHAQ